MVAVLDADRRQQSVLVRRQIYMARASLFLVFLADLSRMAAWPLVDLEPALIGSVDAALAAQNAAVMAGTSRSHRVRAANAPPTSFYRPGASPRRAAHGRSIRAHSTATARPPCVAISAPAPSR